MMLRAEDPCWVRVIVNVSPETALTRTTSELEGSGCNPAGQIVA
jgi:hypothetical protein